MWKNNPFHTTSDHKVDDKKHVFLECNTFSLKRNCFFGMIPSTLPNYEPSNSERELLRILFLPGTEMAVCVSKYSKIIIETRSFRHHAY